MRRVVARCDADKRCGAINGKIATAKNNEKRGRIEGMEKEISKATVARMPLYLRFLQEENSKGTAFISSSVIAQSISVSAVLVRKDLALVSSEAGRPRLGFRVPRLIAAWKVGVRVLSEGA